MAKVTGPLLSISARGSIAKTQVYSTWKGVPYVRQHVTPANPKSTGQVLTRDIFRNLENRWKTGGPLFRAGWDLFATGQALTGRNAEMGQNIAVLRGEVDMAKFIASPGAKGGLAASSIIVTPGSTQLSIAVTVPAPPTGWTLTSAIGTCLIDQTPEAAVSDVIQEVEDLTAPYTLVLTGLSLVLYQCQVWLKWAKPDGSVAYGPSIVGSGTPTA